MVCPAGHPKPVTRLISLNPHNQPVREGTATVPIFPKRKLRPTPVLQQRRLSELGLLISNHRTTQLPPTTTTSQAGLLGQICRVLDRKQGGLSFSPRGPHWPHIPWVILHRLPLHLSDGRRARFPTNSRVDLWFA